MWIFQNDSFLSIVAFRDKPGVLLVRGRKAGDIEAVFPKAKSRENEGTDYQFRADVPAEEVAEAMAERIRAIGYGNFKDSVEDEPRHNAYTDVWTVMRRWGDKQSS